MNEDRLFEKDIRGQLCSRSGCYLEAFMYGICPEHLKERGTKRSKRKETYEQEVGNGRPE